MAIVRSNELVAAIQENQRQVVAGMEQPAHLAVVRYCDPNNIEKYKPTASYGVQIRNHAASIGVGHSEYVITPDSRQSAAQIVRKLCRMRIPVMPLYPLPDASAVKAELQNYPDLDVDDLLGKRRRAPTARAMIAMANLSLHGADYFQGKTLDDLSELNLPADRPAGKIRFGGEGQLTVGPLRKILADQKIPTFNIQVATASTPKRLGRLPLRALIFTATPQAEQIRDEDILPDSIIVDAGFGIVNGEIRGNTDHRVAAREDVLWTPPRDGVGPVSTAYLFHHLLEAAGANPLDMPVLGIPAETESVDRAALYVV